MAQLRRIVAALFCCLTIVSMASSSRLHPRKHKNKPLKLPLDATRPPRPTTTFQFTSTISDNITIPATQSSSLATTSLSSGTSTMSISSPFTTVDNTSSNPPTNVTDSTETPTTTPNGNSTATPEFTTMPMSTNSGNGTDQTTTTEAPFFCYACQSHGNTGESEPCNDPQAYERTPLAVQRVPCANSCAIFQWPFLGFTSMTIRSCGINGMPNSCFGDAKNRNVCYCDDSLCNSRNTTTPLGPATTSLIPMSTVRPTSAGASTGFAFSGFTAVLLLPALNMAGFIRN